MGPAGACLLLELTWGTPWNRSAPIAYVPSPRRWRVEMPECARGIVEAASSPEIQEQTRYMNFIWQEVD